MKWLRLLIIVYIISNMGLMSFFKRDKGDEKSHILINDAGCEGSSCEKCVIACPNNVLIKNEGHTIVNNAFACKHCRVCEAVCPNDCITVN